MDRWPAEYNVELLLFRGPKKSKNTTLPMSLKKLIQKKKVTSKKDDIVLKELKTDKTMIEGLKRDASVQQTKKGAVLQRLG